MEWVASTLHTTLEHGVSSVTTITTADAHIAAASSRLNWRPRRFKWTHPFRRKTKSGFCACAITFQTQSDSHVRGGWRHSRFPALCMSLYSPTSVSCACPCTEVTEKSLLAIPSTPYTRCYSSPFQRNYLYWDLVVRRSAGTSFFFFLC